MFFKIHMFLFSSFLSVPKTCLPEETSTIYHVYDQFIQFCCDSSDYVLHHYFLLTPLPKSLPLAHRTTSLVLQHERTSLYFFTIYFSQRRSTKYFAHSIAPSKSCSSCSCPWPEKMKGCPELEEEDANITLF